MKKSKNLLGRRVLRRKNKNKKASWEEMNECKKDGETNDRNL